MINYLDFYNNSILLYKVTVCIDLIAAWLIIIQSILILWNIIRGV